MRLPYGTVSAEEQAHLISLYMENAHPSDWPRMLPAEPVWVALDVLRADGGWLHWGEWIERTARVLWLGTGGALPHGRPWYRTGGDATNLAHTAHSRVGSLHHRDEDGRVLRLVEAEYPQRGWRVVRATRFVEVAHPPLSGTRWVPAPEPGQLSLLEAA